ncbi:RNase P subunit p30 family protein, partial [Candidatus Altiarchaeota archaeon]
MNPKKQEFWDLHIKSSSNTKESIQKAAELGWHGICLVESFKDSKQYTSSLKKTNEMKLGILRGALLDGIKGKEIQQQARKALDSGADLIFYSAKNIEENRMASECWEVDVICAPESTSEKDFMDQRQSGVDDVIAKNMAERCMALEVSLSSLLDTQGRKRAETMGRIRQNLVLAKKYGVPVIFT